MSKLLAEQVLAELARNHGLEFVIFRFGSVFGLSPALRFHTAINKFIWQSCFGQPLTVWRTAMLQERPYLETTDAIRALSFVLERRLFDSGTYNVVSLNATVEGILAVLREYVSELSVRFVESPVMNELSYSVSSERFRRLGFEFGGDLHTGIRDSIDLLRNASGMLMKAA